MIHDNAQAGDAAECGLTMRQSMNESFPAPSMRYVVECIGADGQVKWREEFSNLVTTAGKTDIVDKYLKGSGYTAAWYCLLKGTGSAAAGDTLASHAGWSEVTPYSGNRPTITWGTTSSGSNTSSAVGISITGSATVAGAGVSSVNTGTSGTLYSAGDFSASRSVISGDTLNVTITISVS